jgi:hypothetical protein
VAFVAHALVAGTGPDGWMRMKFLLDKNMVYRSASIILAALALTSGHALAASIVIAPEQLRDLKDQRALLGAQIKKLDNITKQIASVQAEKNSAKASIRQQEAESKEARIKLEKLQNFDRDNPGEISPAQLNAAVDRNKQAFNALKEAKELVANTDAKINSLSGEGSTQYAEFLRLQKSFERDVSRVVDVYVDEQIRTLQISKDVEVTERVPCGEDSIPVCKERSKKAAELKATERGSIVFVNSFTEVKNFKLSKEELRSEVQATLTNKVFSNQHFVNDSEYETTIKATVVPAISNSLREQIAGAIRSEVYAIVGGKIDYSQVRDPSRFATSAQAEESEEIPPPVKATKSKKKAVKEELAEDQEVQQEEARQEEARLEEARQEDARRRATARTKPKAVFQPTF